MQETARLSRIRPGKNPREFFHEAEMNELAESIRSYGVLQPILVRPADDDARPATGVYSFRVEKPYNPAHYHLQGYPEDLGVLLRRVMIRVEPGGVLMPN